MKITMKILPVQYPIITSYPRHANLLSIIQNSKLKIGWFLENYIQLQINKNIKDEIKLEFHIGYDVISILKHCPAVSYTLFQRELIKNSYNEIEEFIIDYIDKGYYLYFLVNTLYVPNYKSNNNINHDIMIYGYDKIKKIFYTSDFFDGKYSCETVCFEKIRIAYNNINLETGFDWLHGVIGLKPDEHYINEINIKNIKTNLFEYINGKNSSLHNKLLFGYMNSAEYTFGTNVYSVLNKYLIYMREYNRRNKFHKLDLRPFHLLYDHKEILLNLLNYLNEGAYLNKNLKNKYENEIKELKNQALILRNSIVKFNLSFNQKIIEKCICYIDRIKATEEIILRKLYKNIKYYKEDTHEIAKISKLDNFAEFLGIDTETKGDFLDKYGKKGYNLCYLSKEMPKYIDIYINYDFRYCNTIDTNDIRGLAYEEKNSRFSASYVGEKNTFIEIDIFVDNKISRQISLYMLDWYRSQTPLNVRVIETDTQKLKHEITIDDCGEGMYLKYKISGYITIQITSTIPDQMPFFSGILLD